MFKNGVTLNTNGWYCKYLNFLYGMETSQKFQNFCPLFWLLIGSTVMIVPLLIIKFFSKTSEVNKKNFNTVNISMKVGKITAQIFKLLLVILMAFLVSFMLFVLFVSLYCFFETDGMLVMILSACIFAALCFIGYKTFEYFYETSDILNAKRYKYLDIKKKILYAPSCAVVFICKKIIYLLCVPFKFLFAFIYSIYKKACPSINWK